MTQDSKISGKVPAIKFVSIIFMIFCLVFLTTLNFFLYPSSIASAGTAAAAKDNEDAGNDYPSSKAPTEEKSSSGGGSSVLEEFLHENHPAINFAQMNKIFLHMVDEAQKIAMVHTELISPPPKA